MFFSILFFLVITAHLGFSQSMDIEKKCASTCEHHLLSRGQLWFPFSEYFLQEACSNYNHYFNCINKDCPPYETKKLNITSQDFDFCNGSSLFIEQFRSQIHCITTRVKTLQEKCFEQKSDEFQSLWKDSEKECCRFTVYQTCLKEEASDKCGNNSVQLIESLYNNTRLYPSQPCTLLQLPIAEEMCLSNNTLPKAVNKRSDSFKASSGMDLVTIIMLTLVGFVITSMTIIFSVWFLKKQTRSCSVGVVSPSSRANSEI